MNTHQFIKNYFLRHKNDTQSPYIQKWVYKHPTLVKTMEIGGMISGATSVALLPITLLLFRAKAVLLAIIGTIIGLISSLAFKALDIAISPHHSMHTHIFKVGSFGFCWNIDWNE